MNHILRIFTFTIALLALSLGICAQSPARFVGGDLSLLPEYERFNTPYKDQSGTTIPDLLIYLRDVCHWNAVRVRLFVDPVITNADGTKQGEIQDLAYVKALGKRIKDAGMTFMLDFHYSDTWADPVKQYIPRNWQSLTEEQLLDTVYGYTKMCLDTLVAAGATPDFVQIGNEISYGMLWRGTPKSTTDAVHAYNDDTYNSELAQWQRFAGFLKNGARAVREVCPDAQVIIHIERTANTTMCVNFYRYLALQEVDYDIIGLSYYPFWHGWLDVELHNTLTALSNSFPTKPIQLVETAYYNAYWTPAAKDYDTRTKWAVSPAGQDAFLHDLIQKIDQYPNVNGLYYWFPEENGNGGPSWNANTIVIASWINRGLFDPNSHKAYPGLYRLSEYIGVSSGLEELPSAQQPQKQLINGQLIISHDGVSYDVLGRHIF